LLRPVLQPEKTSRHRRKRKKEASTQRRSPRCPFSRFTGVSGFVANIPRNGARMRYLLRSQGARIAVAAGAAAAAVSTHTSLQGSLVTDWGNPEKAHRLEKNYQNHEVIQQRRAMLDLLKPIEGERVLDVGCGPGFMLHSLADAVGLSGSVEGVDPSSVMCDLARNRLSSAPSATIRLGSATALPYSDASFDVVVLSQVFLLASS